jgi:hypothetical protein
MLFEGALLALIVGRLAGGRFHRLGRIPLRYPLLFVAALVLKALALATPSRGQWQPAAIAAPYVHLGAYALLIAALALNWGVPDLRIIALGVGLNFLVLAANAGYMPTDVRAVERSGQPRMVRELRAGRIGLSVVADEHSRLAFLGDRFVPPRPYPRRAPFSVGDVVITLGACLLILRGMGAFGLRLPGASRGAVGA